MSCRLNSPRRDRTLGRKEEAPRSGGNTGRCRVMDTGGVSEMARRIPRRGFLKKVGFGLGALTFGSALMGRGAEFQASAQSGGTLTYGMAGTLDTLDVTVTTSTFTGRVGLHLADPLV